MTENTDVPERYRASLEKLDKIAHGESVELTGTNTGEARNPFVNVRLGQTSSRGSVEPLSADEQRKLDRANAGSLGGLKRVTKLRHQKSIFEK